jgi:hypothetical protein
MKVEKVPSEEDLVNKKLFEWKNTALADRYCPICNGKYLSGCCRHYIDAVNEFYRSEAKLERFKLMMKYAINHGGEFEI